MDPLFIGTAAGVIGIALVVIIGYLLLKDRIADVD